jgi:sulfatase modifying factor 1
MTANPPSAVLLSPHCESSGGFYLGGYLTVAGWIITLTLGLLMACGGQAAEPDSFRDCGLCPKMVKLASEPFEMGSPQDEDKREPDEGPQHRVELTDNFALAQFEVSVAEFAFFLAITHYVPPKGCWYVNPDSQGWQENFQASWREPGFEQRENHPVTCINWLDAQAYITWLRNKTGKHYRLPTEAEWEYAIRAGETRSRYWGDAEADTCEYANAVDETARMTYVKWNYARCLDGYVYTSPVGTFKPNLWGLHDMAGNLWEWVSDCWNPTYVHAPKTGSTWTEGNCRRRVIRGGAWDDEPDDLRSANRLSVPADRRYNTIGFRVARDLDE